MKKIHKRNCKKCGKEFTADPPQRLYCDECRVFHQDIQQFKGDCCEICGYKGKPTELTVHHIKSKAKGGPSSPENAATLCRGCHMAVHSLRKKLTILIKDVDWNRLKQLVSKADARFKQRRYGRGWY